MSTLLQLKWKTIIHRKSFMVAKGQKHPARARRAFLTLRQSFVNPSFKKCQDSITVLDLNNRYGWGNFRESEVFIVCARLFSNEKEIEPLASHTQERW